MLLFFFRFLYRVSNVAAGDRRENRKVRSVGYLLLFFLSELIVQSMCSETWFDDVHVCGCLRDEFINGFDGAKLAWSHGYPSILRNTHYVEHFQPQRAEYIVQAKAAKVAPTCILCCTWKTDDKWLHIRQNAGTLHTMLILFAGLNAAFIFQDPLWLSSLLIFWI